MTDGESIELRAGDYRLVLQPAPGGAITRFDWQGEPLFRTTCGPSVLDQACFTLVPFSNRIADGVFAWGDRQVRIAPNFPGGDHPHPLHGFGWLNPWEVVSSSAAEVVLRHAHRAGDWPWDYRCEQVLTLTADGLRHHVALHNEGDVPMPAGLGFHPYFPCNAQTRYFGLHRGEWHTGRDGLPVALHEMAQPIDWWHGQPVASRAVDTVYTGRSGSLFLSWPDRNLGLTVDPCDDLPFTVVYSPADADFFCVEPVSHATDALNSTDPKSGQRHLAAGESFQACVRYKAARLGQVIPKMRPRA